MAGFENIKDISIRLFSILMFFLLASCSGDSKTLPKADGIKAEVYLEDCSFSFDEECKKDFESLENHMNLLEENVFVSRIDFQTKFDNFKAFKEYYDESITELATAQAMPESYLITFFEGTTYEDVELSLSEFNSIPRIRAVASHDEDACYTYDSSLEKFVEDVCETEPLFINDKNSLVTIGLSACEEELNCPERALTKQYILDLKTKSIVKSVEFQDQKYFRDTLMEEYPDRNIENDPERFLIYFVPGSEIAEVDLILDGIKEQSYINAVYSSY